MKVNNTEVNTIFKKFSNKYKRNMLVANLTTRQYVECVDSFEIDNCLRHLLSVNNKHTAILKADVGESIWRRDDRIVQVEPHLEKYVKKEFGGVYIHDVIKHKTKYLLK